MVKLEQRDSKSPMSYDCRVKKMYIRNSIPSKINPKRDNPLKDAYYFIKEKVMQLIPEEYYLRKSEQKIASRLENI